MLYETERALLGIIGAWRISIKTLAIAALFIFPGLSGFPQEVQQDETPAAKPVVEENVAFPILIGIP